MHCVWFEHLNIFSVLIVFLFVYDCGVYIFISDIAIPSGSLRFYTSVAYKSYASGSIRNVTYKLYPLSKDKSEFIICYGDK